MATQLHVAKCPRRTEGDGMENTEGKPKPVVNEVTRTHLEASDAKGKTLISLKPTVFARRKESGTMSTWNMKEPKFVPYEPYKAAVRPIVPKKKSTRLKKKAAGGSLEQVNACVADCKIEDTESESSSPKRFSKDAEAEIAKLKVENEELEKQLNFEVQVNGELKHLLVAAVGEDMETRVNCLTQDKLQLAQALVKSANTLSTHQEQVEWLAGQCEVWRSKFLASSVMVEELARWKASLSQKINECRSLMMEMLDERKQLRTNVLQIYDNLVLLRDSFDLHSKRVPPKSSHNLELTSLCANISDGLVVQLLGGGKKANASSLLSKTRTLTEIESAVDHTLKNPHPLHLIGEADAACNAVMGAAVAVSSHIYNSTYGPPRLASCPHCTGQIKLI